MAEFLFQTPQEITATTIMGGNVDVDKYIFCIANVQLTIIEPLLGTLLYDKIYTDAEADELAGDYLILYNDYIKPIVKNTAVAEYLTIASYMVTNGGIFKKTGENLEVVDKQEAQFLAQKYNGYGQMFIQRFEKWICNNPLPEYKCYQDEVNANRNIKVTAGWKLDGNFNTCDRSWYLQ
jgi:hypothetical protein